MKIRISFFPISILSIAGGAASILCWKGVDILVTLDADGRAVDGQGPAIKNPTAADVVARFTLHKLLVYL